MQVKAILLTPLLAAGIVSAAPQKSTQFEALALRSGSEIHFSGLQAAKSHISTNLKKQVASCDKGKTDNRATFNLIGDELFLYKTDNPPQQLYVDRSGMGQGVLGYTTGVEPIPRNGEQNGWKIDKNGNLTFKGKGFIACPNSKKAGGSYSVWVDAGVSNPGFNKNCVGFSARTFKIEKPTGCLYTQQE
ncbi:Cell wall protein phiA [Fusarium oxysporum f. sp. raphani]|uniref:Cell wall protein phiA n=1 Tax=Fusarium oxysporum f. sp. raphani TaxID=96318 RepID=A0A8J5UNG8_FUSOX|nr:Cell wall protein phiA [Fusarium oxysporum f. sp. raphani]